MTRTEVDLLVADALLLATAQLTPKIWPTADCELFRSHLWTTISGFYSAPCLRFGFCATACCFRVIELDTWTASRRAEDHLEDLRVGNVLCNRHGGYLKKYDHGVVQPLEMIEHLHLQMLGLLHLLDGLEDELAITQVEIALHDVVAPAAALASTHSTALYHEMDAYRWRFRRRGEVTVSMTMKEVNVDALMEMFGAPPSEPPSPAGAPSPAPAPSPPLGAGLAPAPPPIC